VAPPRAIWTGTITFGLVNAPVRMYTAISENDLRFNMIHQPDGGRIGYQKVCKVDGEEVPADEIVRAFDVGGGDYVELTADDFAAASQESYRTITVHDFVPSEQIDPIYFERTYYLGPQEGSGEPIYALLARAMSESGLSAVVTYIHHDREHLGCLRVRDGLLTLEKMFFHDEVRSADGLAPSVARVDKRQLKMATDLIDAYRGEFDPTKYEDTYRAKLLEIIEQKRAGKTIEPREAPAEEATPDLMAALTASLEEARKAREGRPKGGEARTKGGAKRATSGAGAGRRKAASRSGRRGS
jgi:DNA end-binding protein Ku